MTERRFLVVEGGGDSSSGKVDCRKGFRQLLERAQLTSKPRIVAGSGRQQTFEKFKSLLLEHSAAILLVDSEGPVDEAHREDPWKHLQAEGWTKPPGAAAAHCHLMVQFLESWFLVSPVALGQYFGQGFKADKLGNVSDLEKISKADVTKRIASAVKDTAKGRYDKGRDTSTILGQLDPEKLKSASYFARRFFAALS